MTKIIGADAARLAGLQIDMLQKLRNGQMTVEQLERFNNLSPKTREERFGGSTIKTIDVPFGMIVRRVMVNRALSTQQMVLYTGHTPFRFNDEVWSNMPEDGALEVVEEVDVYFFQLGRFVENEELVAEFESRHLSPDLRAQIQVNIDDVSFADEFPNVYQWRVGDRFCNLSFGRLADSNEHLVRVDGAPRGLGGPYWLAGVLRK